MNWFKNVLVLMLCFALFTTQAFASASRILDGQEITNGAALLVLPTTSDTMVGRATTDTLTNKSMSGSANTFTNIPLASAVSGQLPVANGGTGSATLTAHGVLLGEGTSALAAITGSQYQVLSANASGDPSFQAVNLAQSAAVTGILGHANGGSDSATLAGGAANFLGSLTGATTSGFFLEYNGTNYVFSSLPTMTPSLNGGSGAAESIVAGTGVTLTSIGYSNYAWLISSTAGNTTVTATPSVTAGTADGQRLVLVGTDATETVTLQDQANLSGSGLSLNGNWLAGKDSSLTLHWDATQSLWVEDSRR